MNQFCLKEEFFRVEKDFLISLPEESFYDKASQSKQQEFGLIFSHYLANFAFVIHKW